MDLSQETARSDSRRGNVLVYVILCAAVVAVLAIVIAGLSSHAKGYDWNQTLSYQGVTYGDFQPVAMDRVGIPSQVRGTVAPVDDLWGPMVYRTDVTINGHVYGNCAGEGIQLPNVKPWLPGYYKSVICSLQN